MLELFCGIGGLHWALKGTQSFLIIQKNANLYKSANEHEYYYLLHAETEIPFEIVGALEINPTVLETYALNFPDVRILRRNIESLTAEEIDEMGVDAVLMSPPCQPFCRYFNHSTSKLLPFCLQFQSSLRTGQGTSRACWTKDRLH